MAKRSVRRGNRVHGSRASRLLALLDEIGLEDNTAIILVGDHGEEFFERGWLGHTASLHHEVIQVPLIVRLPGFQPRSRIMSQVVETRAIFPTVLDYLGVRYSDRPLSGSLLGPGFGADAGSRTAARSTEPSLAFSMCNLDEPACRDQGKCVRLASVQLDDWKLIEDSRLERTFLYDLKQDPLEMNDLSAIETDRLIALQGHLETWEQSLISFDGATERPDLSDEELERLRALGYL